MIFKRFYTNKKNFEVIFNNGLNIIYSEVKNNKTEHGSGKSTFFKLIDYCLLANPDEKFLENTYFNDLELYLELSFKNYNNFKIMRNFEDLDNINIAYDGKNFEKISIGNAKELFRELFFGLKKEESIYLSFRKLINFLFRFENDYDDSFSRKNMFNKNININLLNLYFIGLDESKISDKNLLSKRKGDIEKLILGLKIYIKDNQIENLSNLKPQKILLEEEIKRRERKLKEFKVLDEYKEIENESNLITKKLEELNNKMYVESENLKEYEIAYEENSDFNIDDLENFYNSIEVNLGENVKKSFSEVTNFNHKLINNRNEFISDEVKRIKNILNKYNFEFKELEVKRSKNLILLKNFGALDEHNKLTSNLESKKKDLFEIESLIKKREEIKKYTDLKKNLEEQLNELNKNIEVNFEKNDNKIRDLVILFNKTFEKIIKTNGFLTIDTKEVKSNENNNVILKIDSERSTSDGVEKAKIFSYDFSLLELNQFNSRIANFLFHDGIAIHIHKNHIKEIFNMILEKSNKFEFQYFLSLNSDKMPDYEKYKEKIILELSDEKNLLGFDF